MEILSSAGPWLYPLLLLAACLGASIVRALMIIGSERPVPPAGPPHHPVVAWGVLAAVVGLLGTVVGFARLATGAQAVATEDDVELQALMEVLWSGAAVVASPATLGLALFTLSLVAWLLLGFLLNRRAGTSRTP